MRAAKNFVYGDGNDRRVFRVGDEVPKKIVEDVDGGLILEKLAKSDPSSLTREQLLVMAGVSKEDGTAIAGDEEATESQFREAMAEIKTKPQLASWAKEFFNLDLDSKKMSREEMEDTIVAAWSGEEVEEEVEEEE